MAGRWRESTDRTTSSPGRAGPRSASRSTAGASSRTTSAKSTRPSKGSAAKAIKPGPNGLDPRRPFDPAILRRALRIAEQYQLVISLEPDCGYFGRTLELPYAMGDGRTIAACARNVLRANQLVVADMIESGEEPPSPVESGERDNEVSVRLSTNERRRLESRAQSEGFRSLSDYVRSAALRATG